LDDGVKIQKLTSLYNNADEKEKNIIKKIIIQA
jgi:hypothetical protein